MTDRQSGRFGVISNSTVVSLQPSAEAMSWPIWHSSSMRKMPSSMAYGKSPLVRPSSPSEQSMPLDITPLSLPLVILTPFGSSDLCRATGTMSPAWTLDAPVTICTGSSWPTSSWQITRWSESGCFSTDRILPTTTFLTSSNSVFQPSTFEPDILIASEKSRIETSPIST